MLAFSQAGTGVYQFLELPVSSRLAALGGANISVRDNDLNFGFGNPALLTSETNNVVGLSMASYVSDIKFGSAVYGTTVSKNNFVAVGIQYIDYGDLKYANETNTQVGDTYFQAKEMALNIMYSRALTDRFSVGATLKPINSVFERYSSFGMAMDAGVSYNDPKHYFSAGLVLRNVGGQFKGYYSDGSSQHFEQLPFNIQLGISQKLAYAPLRFSMTLHNLQQWDLNHQLTNQPNRSLNVNPNEEVGISSVIGTVDMALRHTIFAVEFVPSKNFYISVGYNHRRQQEMNVNGFKTGAGFSFGGGIKLYKFHVGFATMHFLPGLASYQVSISTALNDFRL